MYVYVCIYICIYTGGRGDNERVFAHAPGAGAIDKVK